MEWCPSLSPERHTRDMVTHRNVGHCIFNSFAKAEH